MSTVLICLSGLLTNSVLGESATEDLTLGELKIEGKYIERLVMIGQDGRRKEFNQPEETIRLPVGEYRLQEVHLEGGYIYRGRPLSETHKVMVAEDKQAVLKAGAPLKQGLKVERLGGILKLHYELVGTGAETYTPAGRGKLPPPTFTVYKGDKEITSGKFEYG